MAKRLEPFQRFKDDGKTKRCQGEIFHAFKSHPLRVGGPGFTPEHVKQCRSAAKYDLGTFCKIHCSDSIKTRKAIALSVKLNKAEALLRKHGRI